MKRVKEKGAHRQRNVSGEPERGKNRNILKTEGDRERKHERHREIDNGDIKMT
jgi:hypothetical protein